MTTENPDGPTGIAGGKERSSTGKSAWMSYWQNSEHLLTVMNPDLWPTVLDGKGRQEQQHEAGDDRPPPRAFSPRPEPAMTSLRQIEANRRNATNSTGPRTTRGKAVVALNAVQHGILSRQAVIQGESEAELVDLGKRLRGQLAPMGELELLLADRIISTAWRLRRAIALETKLFDTERGDSSAYYDALVYKSDRNRLQLFSRYELTLERSLFRALHELRRLQAERCGMPVPPPIAIDITAAPTEPVEAA